GAHGHRGSLFRSGRAAFGMSVPSVASARRTSTARAHRSIAAETEIIKLLMRQFLTNKSVFEDRLYDRMAVSKSIAAVGGAPSWQEVGAAFLSLRTIRRRPSSLWSPSQRTAIKSISLSTATTG